MKDNLAEYYNERYAGAYRQEQKGLELYRVKQVLKDIPSGIISILDYGCGQGVWIKTLAKKFPKAHICGIDISKEAIKLAKNKYPVYSFQSFNEDYAPLINEVYDLVFSYHVLEHVYNLNTTISDISRLIKKGGYLLLVMPCGNRGSFEERITRIIMGGKELSEIGSTRFHYEDKGHLRRITSKDLIGCFDKYGLAIQKEYFSNQLWGAIGWISSTNPAFLKSFFNTNKAVNFYAWRKILLLKLMFLLLNIPMRVYRSKRLTMFPFKVIATPVGFTLDILSFFEWVFKKKEHNGSAQYLIFKKIDNGN
jgi:SAM-dependent methyltransferase